MKRNLGAGITSSPLIDKLRQRQFPPLDYNAEDGIIRKCWNGDSHSVKALLEGFGGDIAQDMHGAEYWVWLEARWLECERFIHQGVADGLEHC